jgi:DNA-binding CsgD family transcriptional regulator
MVLVPHDPVRVLIVSRSSAWKAGLASSPSGWPLHVDVAETVEGALAGLAVGGHDVVVIDRSLASAPRSHVAAAVLQAMVEALGAGGDDGREAPRARVPAASRTTASSPVLTEQERAVLRLMRRHLTYKEIAQRLGVSWHTVRTHAQSILRKHGVHSRRDLERVDPWTDGMPEFGLREPVPG